MPADFRVSITNATGKNAYPISSFTYLLVYKEQTDAAKGKALGQFLWWAIHDGQKLAAPLDYAPLPKPVVAKVEQALRGITVAGQERDREQLMAARCAPIRARVTATSATAPSLSS